VGRGPTHGAAHEIHSPRAGRRGGLHSSSEPIMGGILILYPSIINDFLSTLRWGEARSPSTLPWTTTGKVLFKKSPQGYCGAVLAFDP